MNKLAEYFNNAASQLKATGRLAGASDHRGDNGANREVALRDFLNKHLPNRLQAVLGGKVLGLGQSSSKQIDLFVKNDLAPNYQLSEKSFVLVETLAAAISVKSLMDKAGICDTLENLASIPQNSDRAYRIKVAKPAARYSYDLHYPILIGFGFKGITADTAIDHINDFYKANPSIPNNRKLDMLLVNGTYEISVSDDDRPLSGGGIVSAGRYHWSGTSGNKAGYPLASMINRISHHTSWLPFIDFNFHEYVNEAYDLSDA
jgi:hypothetical protein